MGFDRFSRIVDPTVRPHLLDHGRKVALPRVIAFDIRPVTQRVFQDPSGLRIRQLGRASHRFTDRVEIAAVAGGDKFESAKVVAVLEGEFASGREFQVQGFLRQARLTMPASPLSVPNASSVPSALQASAVTEASPGFFARISAPSSMRTSNTMPSL
jgi:hypothetical protein